VGDDLLVGTRTNAKGHWESRALFRLDDRLLGESGHTWWFPPTADELLSWEAHSPASSFDDARATFDRVHPVEPWVWKDPRACLTLSYWRRALDRPVAGIIVFRNPLDVARSLERRDYMALPFGGALWTRYTRLMLAQARGMPVLVSSYDDIVGNPTGWAGTVRTFLGNLGMPVIPHVGERAIHRFVDPKLQHSSHDRHDLDDAFDDGSCAALYDTLTTLVGAHPSFVPPDCGPEAPWVQHQLDAVGPEWLPTWKVPGSTVPSLPHRVRSLVRRLVSPGR
jgi:hypothetical protein